MARALGRHRRCRTCAGTYFADQGDGTTYYHVCPPQGVRDPHPGDERPNKRDQNIRIGADGKADGIISAGLGTDDI